MWSSRSDALAARSISFLRCGLNPASPPRAAMSSCLNANVARAAAVRRSIAPNPASFTLTMGAVRPCLVYDRRAVMEVFQDPYRNRTHGEKKSPDAYLQHPVGLKIQGRESSFRRGKHEDVLREPHGHAALVDTDAGWARDARDDCYRGGRVASR